MTNVARQIVVESTEFEFDCALDAGGNSPAIVLLFREDEDEVADIDMRQKDWDTFEDLLDAVAWGEELPRSRHNFLLDGLWELKVGSLRATFYDTDGAGGYEPKLGRETWEVGSGRRRLYDPDEMDPYLRLGHWFMKASQKTPPEDLAAAGKIREEDLRHDSRTGEEEPAIEGSDPKAIS